MISFNAELLTNLVFNPSEVNQSNDYQEFLNWDLLAVG